MPIHNHRRVRNARARIRRLHGDERGTISIITLLVLLVFTMLLVMVTNLGRHADDKLKMQNAADAAAITGGVMLSRGLNGLAHTNHLLCEIFALTAYLREGQERNAEQQVPGILQAWGLAGGDLLGSQFLRFRPAGQAVIRRIPLEQQAVTAFGDEQAAAAAHFLPIFETVLEQELIPEFQRTLVQTVPQLAVEAACETVRRHARPTNPAQSDPEAPGKPRRQLKPGDVAVCVLFRANTRAIGEASEANPNTRTLPAIDPTGSSPFGYFKTAVEQRRKLTNHYLQLWNRQKLDLFDHDARMSRFGKLYRIATRGQLDRLLQQDYPRSNLPFQIRRINSSTQPSQMRQLQRTGKWRQVNHHLNQHYHLLAVIYRRHLEEMGPGLFKNPISRHFDAQSFAQLQIYIPEPRLLVNWTKFDKPTTRRYEAEDEILVQARTASKRPATRQNMREFGKQWSGDAQLFWECPNPGQELVVSFIVNGTGRDLRLGFTKAPDYGLFEISLDGKTIGNNVDLYESKIVHDVRDFVGLKLTTGRHSLRFKCVGKNDRSIRYYFGLDYIEFINLQPVIVRENWPEDWDLTNQNWTSRIMPASLPRLSEILARSPSGLDPRAGTLRPGPFATISRDTLDKLVTH